MKRIVTEESLAKRKATKDGLKAAYSRQVVKIDEHWKVKRFDQWNWIVEHKGEFDGYFGSIQAAFKSLPQKMLSDEAKTCLGLIMEAQAAINKRIEGALWDAKKVI